MSLRDDLIEAGARALHDRVARQRHDESTCPFYKGDMARAEAALDVFLDTLADRADERFRDERVSVNEIQLDHLDFWPLLAVLRDSPDG